LLGRVSFVIEPDDRLRSRKPYAQPAAVLENEFKPVRLNDSVIPMFELSLNENFHVGYAYDMTTSALNRYSNGSHEVMINYRVKIPRIHKGLECPTYW